MVKLKMGNQVRWEQTRSGWNYVMGLLSRFNDEKGVLFDGTLDYTFGYNAYQKLQDGAIPYKENWTGFLHSTIALCPFLLPNYLLLDEIILSEPFLQSLPYCKGIFALSEYVAKHIRKTLNGRVEVNSLKHPTEMATLQFNYESYLQKKQVVHAGKWLRRLTSFYQLAAPGHQKIILLKPATQDYWEAEIKAGHFKNATGSYVEAVPYLSNDAYDKLLSASVVFMHVCDSSASNTVVECLMRSTPILINKHPAVVEYLGEEYPFYFTTLEEASLLLMNESLFLMRFSTCISHL